MTDSQTLLTQASCYTCLGVTVDEALELALLAQIASQPSGPTEFISAPFTDFSQQSFVANHGLGATPTSVNAYFLFNLNDDLSTLYRAGDRAKFSQSIVLHGDIFPSNVLWMNATQVGLALPAGWLASVPVAIIQKGGGSDRNIYATGDPTGKGAILLIAEL